MVSHFRRYIAIKTEFLRVYDNFKYLYKKKSGNLLKVLHICRTSLAQVRCDTRSIFKWYKAGLNTEFSFFYTGCLINVKEPSLPYYLLIVEKRTYWFMPFPRALEWTEMQLHVIFTYTRNSFYLNISSLLD